MKLPSLDLKLVSKKDWSSLNKKVSDIKSTANVRPLAELFNYSNRGGIGRTRGMTSGYGGYFSGLRINQMQELSLLSSVYAQAVDALQWEIFRRGGEFTPRFESKCSNRGCEKEFEFQVDECDECHSLTVGPDFKQLVEVKKFWEKCNQKQGALDVCRESEGDIDVVDDLFIILAKEYSFNSDGEIIPEETRVMEMVRGNPAVMDLIADRELNLGYDYEGNPVFTCPVHRDREYNKEGRCSDSDCNLKLMPAWYVADAYQLGVKEGSASKDRIYYLPGEVVHASKYHPGLGRGVPPFFSVYQKVLIELGQDWYIRKSYEKGRPPNSWLFVKTANIASLKKMVKWVSDRLRVNPHEVVPIGIDTQTNGNFVNHVDMLKSQQEMQAVDYRNTIKKEIGARLGVMPLFQGDMSSGGGLNNEGLQITVTNRAVETGQGVFNTGVFPEILKAFGVTDFKYELLPSEERDEMAELQRDSLEIDNAHKMLSMGFDVELNEDGSFDFSGEADPSALVESPTFGSNPLEDTSPQSVGGQPSSLRMSAKGRLPKAAKELRGEDLAVAGTLEGELSKMVEALKLKNRISKSAMKRRVNKLVSRFGERSRSKINKEIKNVYMSTQDVVGKELNRNILFGTVDKNAIDLLSSSKSLTVAYDGMTEKLSDRINDIVEKSYDDPGGLSIDKIVKNMQEEADKSESDLRRIARTETTRISNTARKNSYLQSDPEGKGKYKWLGPKDKRTTEICGEISLRSKNGVSLKELRDMVQVVPEKHGTKAVGEFVPHVNCRHTFVKVR